MYPNFSINEIFGNPINNSLNPKENKRKAGIKKMPRKKGIKICSTASLQTQTSTENSGKIRRNRNPVVIAEPLHRKLADSEKHRKLRQDEQQQQTLIANTSGGHHGKAR